MLAAVGAGIYPSVQAAAERMVHVERTVEPDPARHQEYRFYLDRYLETYPRMKDLMHQTTRHVAAAAGGDRAAAGDAGPADG
jgi:sugar (pentulose or hexulose) kinase